MAMSKTVHFKGNFKNKEGNGVVPYCLRFGYSRKWGMTTENKSEVNCTRCAKALDITPAVKVTSSTAGTCQCCFNSFETRQRGENAPFRMVAHGYTRPGHGYLMGMCRGEGHPPFEVSCEQTKMFRQELMDFLASEQVYLKQLENYEIAELPTKVKNGERVVGKHGLKVDATVSVMVPRTQMEDYQNPFYPSQPWEQVHGYEYLRKMAIMNVKRSMDAVELDIKTLTKKIETWAPVAFPLAK